MGMILLGLRNLFRNKLRLMIVVLLLATPVFLLLAMQSIADAVGRQTTT